MASVHVAPSQDIENATYEPVKQSVGNSRIQAKSFLQEKHQATPRRALGDVRNIQGQKPTSGKKNVLQSTKKTFMSSQRNQGLSTPFVKPSMTTTKKTHKKMIKILEDDDIKEPVVKSNNQPVLKEMKQGHEKMQKEYAVPFEDTELQFEMPKYLVDLTTGNLIENLWWPSFAQPMKTRRSIDLEIDISKLELEDIPCHNEFVDQPIFPETTYPLDTFPDTDLATPDLFGTVELGDIDQDLKDIEAVCLGNDYESLIQQFEAIDIACQARTGAGKSKPEGAEASFRGEDVVTQSADLKEMDEQLASQCGWF